MRHNEAETIVKLIDPAIQKCVTLVDPVKTLLPVKQSELLHDLFLTTFNCLIILHYQYITAIYICVLPKKYDSYMCFTKEIIRGTLNTLKAIVLPSES